MVVTNSKRQGVSYQIELIDVAGHVVTRASAKLPLLKPNQTVSPPLVSASDQRVYFLDGDTDIRSLDPAGQTKLVKSIADGSNRTLAFAVNPGESRIAVALIAQDSDSAKSTSTGYVEDLAAASNRVALWSNTGRDALRWPVGWYGTAVIDEIDDCGSGYGYGYTGTTACSYHVVDAGMGKRTATVCEGPAVQPSATYVNYSPSGLPTRAGVACNESEQPQSSCGGTFTISAADWTGAEHDFISKTTTSSCGGNVLPVSGCYLSPDGTVMACADSTTSAATLLTVNGSTHNLGRRYNILGWIDGSHFLGEVDASTLGVITAPTGALNSLAFDHADQVDMVTTLPGSL